MLVLEYTWLEKNIFHMDSGLVIKMAHPDSTVIHVLMGVCAESLQSRWTLNNPMDCSIPGSFVHGILQARIPEWIAMPFSRESSWSRDQAHISYISWFGRQVFTTSATWEASPTHEVQIRFLMWIQSKKCRLWIWLKYNYNTTVVQVSQIIQSLWVHLTLIKYH